VLKYVIVSIKIFSDQAVFQAAILRSVNTWAWVFSHMGLLMDTQPLGEVFLLVRWLNPVVFHTHYFIHPQRYFFFLALQPPFGVYFTAL